MSRAVDPAERAERLLAELRTATAEAAGVVKDLRRAMKEARELVDGYYSAKVKAALDAHTASWQGDIEQFWRDAKEDLQRIVDYARQKAEPAILAATTLDQLCLAVAKEVAAHTVYTEDGPYVDYAVDHRRTPPHST